VTGIRVLLFDVGGVLVQLSGVEAMLAWLGKRVTAEELWRRWLQSAPVRLFETGRISADEFAAGVTSEFGLPVEPQQFLDAFIGWPTGLYPGTLEMLARIPRSYCRAILSNSNALHWPRVHSLGCLPDQVLFLDDNLLNVEAAQSYGMHAIRVQGAAEAQHALEALGIIS
jgi:glucose-1-phosphatase